MAGTATAMKLESITTRESKNLGGAAELRESEIAAVAYQLWLKRGRPEGSCNKDWFEARAILMKKNFDADELLNTSPSLDANHAQTHTEPMFECHWKGHWEIWEREWAGPRWVPDVVRIRN